MMSESVMFLFTTSLILWLPASGASVIERSPGDTRYPSFTAAESTRTEGRLTLVSGKRSATPFKTVSNPVWSVVESELRETSSKPVSCMHCLLYTSDAADDLLCVDLGGR